MNSVTSTTPDPVRRRILKAAKRLFYERGYPGTGINDLLEEAGAFKKSLYIHFPSKLELGMAYVRMQEEAILGTIEALFQKHTSYFAFIRAWMRIVRRGLPRHYRFGCPFANLANQTHHIPELADSARNAVIQWTAIFTKGLPELHLKTGRTLDQSDAGEFAERMLFYYQGAVQLYGLSGDLKYIDRLERELLQLEEES